MISTKFWKTLNGGWPELMHVPDEKEAINGVKRLYRHCRGMACAFPVVVVRGRNRRTWTRRGKLVVAIDYEYPFPGWPAIVHDLSHLVHRHMHPGAKPHDSRQARIERDMQAFVIAKLL